MTYIKQIDNDKSRSSLVLFRGSLTLVIHFVLRDT